MVLLLFCTENVSGAPRGMKLLSHAQYFLSASPFEVQDRRKDLLYK